MPLSNMNVPYASTYWVVHGRFLAGEHPTEMDDEATRMRLTALVNSGIRTFVDLTQAFEIKSYDNLLRSVADTQRVEINYRRIPIPDRQVPPPASLSSILDEIDSSMRNETPAFVHCFAGIGRTGTVIGCYLRRHRLATKGNVVAHIGRLRSLMPGGREPSPHTLDQVSMVEKWEDGL
jgi:protein-tyrosine phosphatase